MFTSFVLCRCCRLLPAQLRGGGISNRNFYAWSERAQEMKRKCDRDVITMEEFTEWLERS